MRKPLCLSLIVPLLIPLILTTSCSTNVSDYRYIEGSYSTYTCSVQYDKSIQLELPVNEGDYLQIGITGETIYLNASLTDPTGNNLGSRTFDNNKPIDFPISKKGIYTLTIQGPGSFTVQQVGAQVQLIVSTAVFTAPATAKALTSLKWLMIPVILGAIFLIIFLIKRRRGKIKLPQYLGNVPTIPKSVGDVPLKGHYFGPDGPGTDKIQPPANETINHHEFAQSNTGDPIFYGQIGPSEFQSPLKHIEDSLTNSDISRLVKEGKITIEEAAKTLEIVKNMDFMDRNSFLSAIEHRED